MRLSRALGGIGRALVAFGVLLLLFVAYQLWGTGIQERRAQAELNRQLDALFLDADEGGPSIAQPDGGPLPTTTTTAPPPPPPEGDAVAVIRIPSIGVEKAVVEGVRVADLKKGPGHYPQTPLPGQAGNAAIAGHRTTYGAPFYRLDELDEGEEILVRTVQGEFRYVVDRITVVRPDQVEVLDQTDEARLTLTTCEPRFSARKRLIVSAVLEDEPAPAAPTTTVPPPTDGDADDEEQEPSETVSFEDPAGLSGDPAARWPTFWWGLAVAGVALVLWLLARLWRPFWIYLGGSPVFLLVLFVFYENVSRLLPANI
ncbi:MAG TPA: class E sortase [Acidimicrobiales bacterium]|nr:class E sortase [Acidimicrobiales bacterium]